MAKHTPTTTPTPLFYIVDQYLKAKPIYKQPFLKKTTTYPRTFSTLETTNIFIHELRKLYRNPLIIIERNTTVARLEDKVRTNTLTHKYQIKQLTQSLQEANNVASIYKKESQFTTYKRLAYQTTIVILVFIISLILWI